LGGWGGAGGGGGGGGDGGGGGTIGQSTARMVNQSVFALAFVLISIISAIGWFRAGKPRGAAPKAHLQAPQGPEPKKGTALFVIGVVLLMLGTVFLGIIPVMAMAPSDYKAWSESGPSQGATIDVMGVIKKTDTIDFGPAGSIYVYEFEGCSNCTFLSSENLGDGLIIITIVMDDFGPRVQSQSRYERCAAIGLPLIIFGVALLVLGRSRKKKRAQWMAAMGIKDPAQAAQTQQQAPAAPTGPPSTPPRPPPPDLYAQDYQSRDQVQSPQPSGLEGPPQGNAAEPPQPTQGQDASKPPEDGTHPNN